MSSTLLSFSCVRWVDLGSCAASRRASGAKRYAGRASHRDGVLGIAEFAAHELDKDLRHNLCERGY